MYLECVSWEVGIVCEIRCYELLHWGRAIWDEVICGKDRVGQSTCFPSRRWASCRSDLAWRDHCEKKYEYILVLLIRVLGLKHDG